jgi:ADP-ribosylglycohydrolase
MALRQIYAGVNWRFTGNDSEGCGAAMRVAPLAAFQELRQEDVGTQARITHRNDVAIGGAAAMAKAIHEAYSLKPGFSKEQFIDTVADYTASISQQVATEIRNLKGLLGSGTADVLEHLPHGPSKFRKKGKGTLAVVPAAVYCFLNSPDDFEATVTASVNTSGDSDSIASMAGAVSGAYNGLAGIPQPLISGLQQRDFIGRRIEAFIGRFSIEGSGGE